MEIVKVKTETTIVFEAEEIGMLRTLVTRGAMNLHGYQEDLKEFAELFIIETNKL